MAYREFKEAGPFQQPNLDLMPRTLAVMELVQRQRQQQQQQAYDAAKDIKTFFSDTKMAKYDRKINDYARKATELRMNELNAGYLNPTPQTKQILDEGPRLASMGKANTEELSRLTNQVAQTGRTDKYYKSENDLKKIADVASDQGLSPDEEIAADQEKIANIRQNINHPNEVLENFNQPAHIADYIQGFKEKQFKNEFTGQNGAKNSTLRSALFVNKNNIPDVTNEHVQGLLNAHPKEKQWYTALVLKDLQKEIAQNKAADPNWMAGMTDEQIMSTIVNDPSKNPNPNSIGQTRDENDNIITKPLSLNDRIREKARNDLKQHEKITSEVDTDLSNYNPASSAGVTSKTIRTAEGFTPNSYAGPSRTITRTNSTTQPYLTLQSKAPVRLDLDTGKVVTNNLPRDFKLLGTQVVAVDANGKPINIEGEDTDQLIQKIKEMPASAFGPKGIIGTKMAFRGQSIDNGVLDQAYTKRKELESDLVNDPNDLKAKSTLDKLDQTLEQIKAGEGFNEQFLQRLLNVNILHNELVPVNPGDENVQFVKSQTGMDVYSPKALTPDMKRVQEAVNARVQEVSAAKPVVEAFWKSPAGQKAAKEIKQKNLPLKNKYTAGNGTEYTLDQLKQNGYTEEQIKQAIEMGNLK